MLSLVQFLARTIMAADDVRALARLTLVRNADSAAADVSPERLVGKMPADGASVTALLFTPADDVAASDTDYATLSVYKRTPGTARVLVGAATTKVTGTGAIGNMGAGVAYEIPITAGAVALGDQVTFDIAKTGTGVIVPEATLVAEFSPSYAEGRLAIRASEIFARLKKRYAVPFGDPAPEVALGWQEALTTYDCFLKRGFTPGSAQDAEIVERAKAADLQIKEAADSKDGLFDLPLLESDPSKSGVSVGGPLGYSETSPYVAFDVEGRNGRADDARGCGS